MTVNSPERLDLTDRLPKQGSIDASTPMMLEMEAVGGTTSRNLGLDLGTGEFWLRTPPPGPGRPAGKEQGK